MSEFLRQYSYSEFISEYGVINYIDFEKMEIVTSDGVIVHLSRHYCSAIENNVIQLNISNLRYAYFVLFAEDKYDNDGNKYSEKVWYLFSKDFCHYQGILRTLSCLKILTIELCKEGISAVY